MRPVMLLFTLLALLLTACEQAPETEVSPEVAEAEPCRLVMGWDPWEPYHFAGARGEVQGLDIDLVRAIAAGADCEIELQQGNWASLIQLVQAGELDLLTGATHTDERAEFAWFSEPYREERFQLFVRAEDADRYTGRDLEDLLEQDFRVGVTQGYIYSPEISTLQAEPLWSEQFVDAAVGELNFTSLMDHRIDGFLEDPFVAAAIQRRRGWDDIIAPLDLVYSSGPVHLLFSKATVDRETVAAFDRSLQELRENSEYDAIRKRYLQ